MNLACKTALIGMLVGSISACTTNPVTGERELSIISEAQAQQMGAAQYQEGQQSQGGLYYLDESLNRYISEIGKRLAAESDVPNLPYEFVLLNNPVPNAWALPGGKIAVNRGLLVELEDESQLAAVIGHEIVHAAARHGASQMSRAALFNIGLQIAGAATANTSYGDLVNTGSQLGAAAWMASYGREDELESDHYGMIYMSKAGYDPQGAVELQRTFVRLSEGRGSSFADGLFASHPPSQQRVEANAELAAKLPQGGETYKDRYQQAIRQIKQDQPAYEAQKKAEKALNDKNPQVALDFIAQAIDIQPDESMFWELQGHAFAMLKEAGKAEAAFTTAIEKNPNYYRHWAVRGQYRKSIGKTSESQRDLQKATELLKGS